MNFIDSGLARNLPKARDLSQVPDEKIMSSARECVTQEREARAEFLHYLLEIGRRKLFSDYQCSSLFDLCVRVFGYSESEAHRRILAMRLVGDVPETEAMLASGSRLRRGR